MTAIGVLLVTLTATLLITRFATIALMVTGLSREAARFQARSALTGVGFTTGESEKVINHPVRRQIIMLLMLTGNAGFVTVLATLMGSFLTTNQTNQWVENLTLLALGLFILWIIATSSWIDRRLSRIIYWALKKWTRLDVHDYVALLQVSKGYAVSELQVAPGDWLVGQSLAQARLSKEGVLVLGIQHTDGDYNGAPNAKTVIHAEDTLIVYGTAQRVEELDQRRRGPEGTRAHEQAVSELKQLVEEAESKEEEEESGEPPAESQQENKSET